jgi:hypothetical protein
MEDNIKNRIKKEVIENRDKLENCDIIKCEKYISRI